MMKKASKIVGAILASAWMVFPYGTMLLAWLMDEFSGQITHFMKGSLDFGSVMLVVMAALYVGIALANIVWVIIWSATGGNSEWILLWNLMIRCGYLLVWIFLGLFLIVGLLVWYIGGKDTVIQVCEIWALLLVTPGVYGICGNILAVKERYISTGIAVVMSILQFIPGIDLITAIITYCIVNTRRKKRVLGDFCDTLAVSQV